MRERQINKLVLGYFDDLLGIPQEFEEVHEYVSRRLRKPCEGRVERALATLETAGYLERAERTAADDRMWVITAAGMRQAKKQVPHADLDPLIWDV